MVHISFQYANVVTLLDKNIHSLQTKLLFISEVVGLEADNEKVEYAFLV
jgi:hypothetical protein